MSSTYYTIFSTKQKGVEMNSLTCKKRETKNINIKVKVKNGQFKSFCIEQKLDRCKKC